MKAPPPIPKGWDALQFPDLDKVFPSHELNARPMQMAGSKGIKPRILVANDDPVHMLLLFQALVHAGYEVVVAVTGTQALEELRREDHPTVAILVGHLPSVDSRQICQRMHDAESHVYLILCTDKPTPKEVADGLEKGADVLLRKSDSMEELLAYVKVGLRNVARLQAPSFH